MTLDKEAVGRRLKEFSQRFDSLTEFAGALGMRRQQLYPYLNGQSLPGFEIIARLRELGLDPNWLIAGESGVPSVPVWKGEKLQYDSPEMRQAVEREVDGLVKIAQLWRSPINPALARELRQALRKFAIKQYRAEREETEKAEKRGRKVGKK